MGKPIYWATYHNLCKNKISANALQKAVELARFIRRILILMNSMLVIGIKNNFWLKINSFHFSCIFCNEHNLRLICLRGPKMLQITRFMVLNLIRINHHVCYIENTLIQMHCIFFRLRNRWLKNKGANGSMTVFTNWNAWYWRLLTEM